MGSFKATRLTHEDCFCWNEDEQLKVMTSHPAMCSVQVIMLTGHIKYMTFGMSDQGQHTNFL